MAAGSRKAHPVINRIDSRNRRPVRSGVRRQTAGAIHSDPGRYRTGLCRSTGMSTEETSRTSLILADGYSYTELIPAPGAPDGPSGNGFIRIFHAFFSPNEEGTTADVQQRDCLPLATPEQS